MKIKKIKFIVVLIILINISCASNNKRYKEETKINVVETKKEETKSQKTYINSSDINKVSFKDMAFKISNENYPSISQDDRIKHLVIHYTAGNFESSLKTLTQGEVSSHYLVPDTQDNKIFRLVDERRRAYHAGVSFWRNRTNINDTSIGIEIVNKGYYVSNGEKIFYPFSQIQLNKVAALCLDIIKRYDIDPTNVIGHSDVAPGRKEDPGPLFPWKYLYDNYNIGAWYDNKDKAFFTYEYLLNYHLRSVIEYQKELANYGYDIKLTGVNDQKTKMVIQSFQYHFRPEKADGVMDYETWAILKALNKKYRK